MLLAWEPVAAETPPRGPGEPLRPGEAGWCPTGPDLDRYLEALERSPRLRERTIQVAPPMSWDFAEQAPPAEGPGPHPVTFASTGTCPVTLTGADASSMLAEPDRVSVTVGGGAQS